MRAVISEESFGLDEAIAPESLRPVQFDAIWGVGAATTPERALLLAILERTANDLRHFRYARQRPNQRLFVDAYAWVTSDDRSHAFSFLNVCDALKFSAENIRTALLDGSGIEMEAAA